MSTRIFLIPEKFDTGDGLLRGFVTLNVVPQSMAGRRMTN